MSGRVTSINDVTVVEDEPGAGWIKVRRDLRRPPTTRAMLMLYDDGSIWIAKVWLRIYDGAYYARDFTLKRNPQQ